MHKVNQQRPISHFEDVGLSKISKNEKVESLSRVHELE
jgi:hypothetical protein